MLDQIPESKREAVLRGVQAAFATSTLEELTPLGGGLSSALVIRLVVQGRPRPCLLRLVTRASPRRCVR
jgi:hypothetical protein